MTDTSRTALITGANRGLGRATALHLGRAGVDVVIAYRSNAEQAEEVVAEIAGEGGRAVAVRLDTTDFGAFADFAPRLRETLRETFGREQINALVNNAGTGAYAPFAQTSETQLDEMLDVHVKGPYLLTQALLPLLADGGDVLFVSSGLTRFSTPGYYHGVVCQVRYQPPLVVVRNRRVWKATNRSRRRVQRWSRSACRRGRTGWRRTW